MDIEKKEIAAELYKKNGNNSGAAQPIIRKGLELTDDRKSWLMQRIKQRISELKAGMGLGSSGVTNPNSWMDHRKHFQLQYDSEFEWREREIGGIFEYSNMSLNIAKRFARLIAAKSADDLLGTDPFFTIMPREGTAPELVKQSEAFLQEKISESNMKPACKDAMRIGLILGECVLKSSYQLLQSRFIGEATVLTLPNGEVVLTEKGNLIYEKDDIIPDPVEENVFRLKKEPSFVMPDPEKTGVQFKYHERVQQNQIMKEGVVTKPIYFMDFLCPLNVDDILEADINVHLFDINYGDLNLMYYGLPTWENYKAAYLSSDKQPRAEKGEEQVLERDLQIVNCADVYIRCDADDDGVEEEIWCLVDLHREEPIFYDYLNNHMKTRPFRVVHGIEKVANRWYGVGVFEMIKDKQDYIETQVNRMNWKSSKSSSVIFRNKMACKAWQNGQEVVIGDDTVHDITDPTYNQQTPPIFKVNMMEDDPVGMELMMLAIQVAQNEVGIISADDGGVSAMQSTKTATGVRNMERTSNQLQKWTEATQNEDIVSVAEMTIETILENMDPETLFWNKKTNELYTLNREEIRRLSRDTKLTLSRSRSTETLENSAQVIALQKDYYALDPFLKFKLRDEYIRQLKALEVQDADQRLEEVTEEQANQYLEQQRQAAAQAKEPVLKSVSTKITNLAPSERDQVLESAGITPASPEELAAKDQNDLALKAQEAKVTDKAKPSGDKKNENK